MKILWIVAALCPLACLYGLTEEAQAFVRHQSAHDYCARMVECNRHQEIVADLAELMSRSEWSFLFDALMRELQSLHLWEQFSPLLFAYGHIRATSTGQQKSIYHTQTMQDIAFLEDGGRLISSLGITADSLDTARQICHKKYLQIWEKIMLSDHLVFRRLQPAAAPSISAMTSSILRTIARAIDMAYPSVLHKYEKNFVHAGLVLKDFYQLALLSMVIEPEPIEIKQERRSIVDFIKNKAAQLQIDIGVSRKKHEQILGKHSVPCDTVVMPTELIESHQVHRMIVAEKFLSDRPQLLARLLQEALPIALPSSSDHISGQIAYPESQDHKRPRLGNIEE